MARRKKKPLGLRAPVNFADAKAASSGGFDPIGALKDVGEAAIDVLSAPSRAIGGTIAASQNDGFQLGDLATGVSRSFNDAYDPSDVLGTNNSLVGGLATDILLDPLTYLTGGSLAALKAGAKTAGKALVANELKRSTKASNKIRDVIAEPLDALPSPKQRIKQSAAQQMAMPNRSPKAKPQVQQAKPQLPQGKPRSALKARRPDLVEKKIDQVITNRGITPMGGADMVMNQQRGNIGNNVLYNPPRSKSLYQRVFPAQLKPGDNVKVDGKPKVFVGNTGESRTGKLGKDDRYYFADDTPSLQKWMEEYQKNPKEYVNDNLAEFLDHMLKGDIPPHSYSGKIETNRIGTISNETIDGETLKTLKIMRLNRTSPKGKTGNSSTVSRPSPSSANSSLNEAINNKARARNQQMKDLYRQRGESNLLYNPPRIRKLPLDRIRKDIAYVKEDNFDGFISRVNNLKPRERVLLSDIAPDIPSPKKGHIPMVQIKKIEPVKKGDKYYDHGALIYLEGFEKPFTAKGDQLARSDTLLNGLVEFDGSKWKRSKY